MKKIGILASYNGTGFLALYEACKNLELNATIQLVISNNSDANVLKSASIRDIENHCINSKLYPNDDIDLKISNIFIEKKCDYIFLSGYMKKINQPLLKLYNNRIINSHPSLLPKFGGVGMYGRFVHQAVFEAKEQKTGVTIHFINENYDEGEYILQKEIDIRGLKTVEQIESSVKQIETSAILEAFKNILN